MKKRRPVNLDLTTIKFPPSAIVSILHRVSGIIVFLFIPFLLCMLEKSLSSGEHFNDLALTFAMPINRFFLWVFLSGLIYHLIAGIRHLLMDAHIAEGLKSGRMTAYATMIISFILIVLAGIWLW